LTTIFSNTKTKKQARWALRSGHRTLIELAKRFNGAELHFDMFNKWMSKKSSMHDTVSKTNATFKFGI